MSARIAWGLLDVRDRLARLDHLDHRDGAELGERCRELTFAWTRWSWAGRVLEDSDPERLLSRAVECGARYCFVQAAGHLVVERLRPKAAQLPELVDVLIAGLGEHGWLIGRLQPGHGLGPCLRDSCWLVDLERWSARGRPQLRRTSDQRPVLIAALGDGVVEFPASARALSRELEPERPAHAAALRGQPVDPLALTPAVADFVASIDRTLDRSRRGVFVWNVEPYDDLDALDDDGPLATLHTVAAGFKPNAILRKRGFQSTTEIVFFDYSRAALDFRRRLVEAWDGHDLPAFVSSTLSDGAHYWLRSTVDDEPPARDELETLWARELDDWGGAREFAAHWAATRRLRHHFVHVDLVRAPEPALATAPRAPALVWWSNAFSSVDALWTLRRGARVEAFSRWLEALAACCPDAWLLGADVDNAPIANIRAADYLARSRAWQGGIHEPLRCTSAALRF